MGVKVDLSELTEFSTQLKRLTQTERDTFGENAIKDLAGRMLALVIPRTPVGSYEDERQGGTLRRGWTGLTITPESSGEGWSVTLTNPVEYASYVEEGHRQTPGRYVPAIGKQLVASWVEGQHFLKLSEDDLSKIAPDVLRRLFEDYLRTVF